MNKLDPEYVMLLEVVASAAGGPGTAAAVRGALKVADVLIDRYGHKLATMTKDEIKAAVAELGELPDPQLSDEELAAFAEKFKSIG